MIGGYNSLQFNMMNIESFDNNSILKILLLSRMKIMSLHYQELRHIIKKV